ncbi:MAG: HEAT repeat domain-containing protein [Planctomycetes bacterium]|nr:HEAT repeat domain-containing protein [Planctomycetota bacterium]
MVKYLLSTLLLATSLVAGQQATDQKPKPKWMPAEISRSEEVDDVAAKELIATFTRAFGAAKDPADKKYALDDLAKGRNKKVAATLEKVLLRDKSGALRSHAALCLARLGLPESEASLLKALAAKINEEDDDVLEAVGIALGQTGDKPLFKKLGKEFEGYGKGGKRALVLLFGYRKDEDSLRLLSKWLDEPQPTAVDSPNNPPASYWKQRFAEYHYVKDEVIWAVWRITGELMHSEEEFRDWEKRKAEEEKAARKGMRRR